MSVEQDALLTTLKALYCDRCHNILFLRTDICVLDHAQKT